MDKLVATFENLPPGKYTGTVTATSNVPSVGATVTTLEWEVKEQPKPQPVAPAATAAVAAPVVSRRRKGRRRDPLAQTFELPDEDAYMTRVQLRFSAAPPAPAAGSINAADPPVGIEIREVEDGIPTDVLVAERVYVAASVVRDAIVTTSTANGVVDFNLPSPVLLRAGQRYALVVVTTSPAYQVYYAELGQLELGATGEDARVVTQPYPEGTLLQSSDLSSWDPLPNRDLWFRMYFAEFPATSESFEFDPMLVARANVVGFKLLARFGLLQNDQVVTQVAWEYRTAPQESSVTWSGWKGVQPFARELLDATFQKIQFRVLLRGGDGTRISPFLERDSLSVEFFSRENSARLVSKQLTLAAAYKHVRMIAKIWSPSSASLVDWYFTDGTAAGTPASYSAGSTYAAGALVTYQQSTYTAVGSVAAGATPGPSSTAWAEVELFNNMVWRRVPAAGETKLPVTGMEAGWYEHERQVTLADSSTRTRFFYMFKLSSQNVAQAPAIKDVVCILNG